MTANTQTFVFGRFRLDLAVDPRGRVREQWSPKLPIRLTPAELQAYRSARARFEAAMHARASR